MDFADKLYAVQDFQKASVYFLVKTKAGRGIVDSAGPGVVYVGQTKTSVFSRVGAHHADKSFDWVLVMEVHEPLVEQIEEAFIRLLKPHYNDLMAKRQALTAQHRALLAWLMDEPVSHNRSKMSRQRPQERAGATQTA